MAMEMFQNAKVVRLRSHLNKYLVADEDGQQTRQSRTGGASRSARWSVEAVEGNANAVRLKSCHGGRYLTASDEPLFLGVTGNKVTLSLPENIKDLRIEWHPFKDGFHQIKLRAYGGTFLRANGGVPPWRNSITHDNVPPQTTSTNNWILWNVDAVDEAPENGTPTDCLSAASSFSSISSQLSGLNLGSPSSAPSTSSPGISKTPSITPPTNPAMEIFHMAKKVRLVSHHKKYLIADEDEESVIQGRRGAADNARWSVEYPENTNNLVRLKSCYGKYLTASNHPFLLGMTGRKVLQTLPDPLNSSVEWEPIMEGKLVKLKTRSGRFLRANGGLPPWRNSVTHDTSTHKMAVEDWLLWDVHVLEIVVS